MTTTTTLVILKSVSRAQLMLRNQDNWHNSINSSTSNRFVINLYSTSYKTFGYSFQQWDPQFRIILISRIFVYLRWCNRKKVDGLSFLIYQDFLGFHSNSDYYIYGTYQKIICASKAMYEES